MQGLVDKYISEELIVFSIAYVCLTYLLRFWLNDSPVKWRYVALIFAWTPIALSYVLIAFFGLQYALDWRWLFRFGVMALMFSEALFSENVWRRVLVRIRRQQ